MSHRKVSALPRNAVPCTMNVQTMAHNATACNKMHTTCTYQASCEGKGRRSTTRPTKPAALHAPHRRQP
ncbi:MAG TPA: hypothetical protein DEF41_06875 [Desulfovibrio sp.]|uniref:Uncharacterized protein n=1 Tax=Nitratidesulfovibrio vulgaris (strain ATCC 29579 / DSM 644 / CCUG 34227 / NCIMB 8303 / VKM B-1760 / Hildenborough) TaxID=882 RepID=Q72C67_NITV2|nr:hypothetical protein DVU_1417 [Nitratidesulfovibrio vulgaris str. Hildenborough]HBW15848.1 hypothetical protein [Desulfovibrio sp.]